MIHTEHVSCDTCTAPTAPVFDASDEASRAHPVVDIETNPLQSRLPAFPGASRHCLFGQRCHRTAPRPACSMHRSASTRP